MFSCFFNSQPVVSGDRAAGYNRPQHHEIVFNSDRAYPGAALPVKTGGRATNRLFFYTHSVKSAVFISDQFDSYAAQSVIKLTTQRQIAVFNSTIQYKINIKLTIRLGHDHPTYTYKGVLCDTCDVAWHAFYAHIARARGNRRVWRDVSIFMIVIGFHIT